MIKIQIDKKKNLFSGYKVEKMDTKKGKWEPVREGIKGTKVTVPKLKEGQEYKFRVCAQSPNGDSEPLESEKPMLAKKPFGKIYLKRKISSVLSKV